MYKGLQTSRCTKIPGPQIIRLTEDSGHEGINCFCSVFRKILRLVKHTLASVSGVRDQEMALLDEMLSACAREANNKSLELIFSSHLFYQNRQEKFISSLAGKPHLWTGSTPSL